MSPSKSNAPSAKRKSAVALKYNPEKDYSPVVVASGHGVAAERIIQIADDSGVPVFRDDSATALLSMLEIGQGVPQELFEVVAAIYIEILKTSREMQDKMLL